MDSLNITQGVQLSSPQVPGNDDYKKTETTTALILGSAIGAIATVGTFFATLAAGIPLAFVAACAVGAVTTLLVAGYVLTRFETSPKLNGSKQRLNEAQQELNIETQKLNQILQQQKQAEVERVRQAPEKLQKKIAKIESEIEKDKEEQKANSDSSMLKMTDTSKNAIGQLNSSLAGIHDWEIQMAFSSETIGLSAEEKKAMLAPYMEKYAHLMPK